MARCTDAEAVDYTAWLLREGVTLNGVALATFSDTGRGVVALRPLRRGETVVSVPDDLPLLADGGIAAAALAAAGITQNDTPRMRREALVLALMAELAAGRESRWAPYLAALPTLDTLHVPVGWSAAEAAALRGTSAAARLRGAGGAADELPSGTERAWSELGAPLAAEQPSLRLPAGAAGAALHARATALVAAYSFSLGAKGAHQALVPFWDALNHTHPAAASVRLHHDEASGRLNMVTVRAVAAGAEVFNTYGPLGTSELVRRYGFAAPGDNPHDVAEVSGRELLRAAAAAGAGVQPGALRAGARLARQAGLLDGRFALPRHGAPPPRLLLALRTLCGTGGETAAAAARLRRARTPAPPAGAAAHRLAVTMAAALAALAARGRRRLSGATGDAAPSQPRPRKARLALAARVRGAELACFDALSRWAEQQRARVERCSADAVARSPLLLRSGAADAAAEMALWRRGVRAAAKRALLAARRRRPRPPDLTCPVVLRRLCLAGAVRFRPPRAKRSRQDADDDAGAQQPQRQAAACACTDAGCRAALCSRGPFTMPAAMRRAPDARA